MEIRDAGCDDGHVLRDLDAEGCAPVVVCEVWGIDVAVEVDELGYYWDDDAGGGISLEGAAREEK